jgi:hypothetical protein
LSEFHKEFRDKIFFILKSPKTKILKLGFGPFWTPHIWESQRYKKSVGTLQTVFPPQGIQLLD